MRTIIFDFDGTIADSFEMLLEVFQSITKRKTKLSQDEVEQLRGMQVKGILKQLKLRRWQIPRLLIRGRRAISEKIDTIKPIDGLPQVIQELQSQGYTMIILSTNSAVNINRFLDNNNLADCFQSVHGGVGIFSKASALRNLLKKEKLSPQDCIYIGDEVRDVEAAERVGINYISVAWGFSSEMALKATNPQHLVIGPEQLSPTIAEIFKI